MEFIGLKLGQDLGNWAAHPYQEFRGVPPPPSPAVNITKSQEMVGHLPHEFSRVVWYFLAHSGEISFHLISPRGHCKQLSYAEEWKFHAGWSLDAPAKRKSVV